MTAMASFARSRPSSSSSLLRLLSISSLAIVLSLLPLLSSADSAPATCGGAGFDLTPLSVTSNPAVDLDLVYTDGSYWYGLHPCGIVKESFCPTPAAMMCEYATTLAYNTPTDIVWTAYSAQNNTVTGVTMTVANGQPCQVGTDKAQPRSINVRFICDAGVQEAKMISVTRPTTCSTEAVVLTRYACADMGVTTDSSRGLSSSQKQTIAIVVSVVSALVMMAMTVLCVVMCRRWRAGQVVWTKSNKLLDGVTTDDTDKGVELSISRV